LDLAAPGPVDSRAPPPWHRLLCTTATEYAYASAIQSDLRGPSKLPGASSLSAGQLDAFDGERDALAYADAHGGEGAAAARALQLVCGGEDEAGAAHAERMAECDGAAVGVDVRSVIGNAELAQARERLAGKRLVEFNDVEIGCREIQTGQQLFC